MISHLFVLICNVEVILLCQMFGYCFVFDLAYFFVQQIVPKVRRAVPGNEEKSVHFFGENPFPPLAFAEFGGDDFFDDVTADAHIIGNFDFVQICSQFPQNAYFGFLWQLIFHFYEHVKQQSVCLG